MSDKQLQAVLRENGGIITAKQGADAGFPHMRLLRGMKSGELARVGRGVYMSPGELDDVMHVAQLRRPQIVFSHDSALVLHDLTDRYPFSHSVTVPTGYNTKLLVRDGFTVFSVKRKLYEMDIIRTETPIAHAVRAYSLERTVVDCVRSRSRMEAEIVTEALKRYARRPDKNIGKLMDVAKLFGVEKLMRTYMEVLL